MFDVQGHFLEHRVDPPTRQAREFWTGFPQRQCGEADGRACYSIARFMEEVFLKMTEEEAVSTPGEQGA